MNQTATRKSSQSLFFTDEGSGEAIVLLHGMLGSHRYWAKIAPKLTSYYRVVAFDLLGFGRSPKPNDIQYSLDDHIEALMESIDSLGIKKFTLVGHSMGSIISLAIAEKYPNRVKRLILTSMPVYETSAIAKQNIIRSNIVPKLMIYGSTARISCRLVCRFRPQMKKLAPIFIRDVPREVAIDSLDHTWQSYSGSMQNVVQEQNVIGQLKNLTLPTTILVGIKDVITQAYDPKRLADLSKYINVKFLDTTHQLPLEDPEGLLEAIRN